MNKKQFIDKMLVKFMSNAQENQARQTEGEYEQFLSSSLDYDYLYEKVITEYNLKSVPSIAWLKPHFRTAKEFNDNTTYTTWKIFAETKSGNPYEFHCYVSVPETVGIAEFKKERPELIYVGNNYKEVVEYGY